MIQKNDTYLKIEDLDKKLIIIIAIFLVYFIALFGGFIWDDWAFIVQNPLIKNLQYVPTLLFKKVFPLYFRPVRMLSFAFDYQLWGLNPFGFKLTNILLHIIASIVVFDLLKLIFKDRHAAFFITLLWVLHPVRVESLAFIKNRSDIVAMIFITAAFIYYIKGNIALMLILYLLGVNTKEAGMMLIPILFVYEFIFKNTFSVNNLRSMKKYSGFYILIFITLLYLWIRWHFLGVADLTPKDVVVPFTLMDKTFFVRLLNFPRIMLFFIYKSVLPLNLCIDYKLNVVASFWPVFISWLGLLSVLYGTYVLYKKKAKNIVFGIAYYLFTLIVVSSLIVPLPRIVSDHNQYIPGLGFAIFTYFILKKALSRRSAIMQKTVMVGILLIYAGMTITNIPNWKEEKTVWLHAIKVSPTNERAYSMLGNIYTKEKKYKQAKNYFKKAVEINPNFYEGLSNLAGTYISLYQYDKAQKIYEDLITRAPDFVNGYIGLGELLYQKEEYKESLKYYLQALKLDRTNFDAALRVYETSRNTGDTAMANAYFERIRDTLIRAKAKAPKEYNLYKYLGSLYVLKAEYSKSLKYFEKAKDLNPKSIEIDKIMGDVYKKIGRYDAAIGFYQTAVDKNPFFINALNNLANAEMQIGEFSLAEDHLKRVLKLNPRVFQTYYNLGDLYEKLGRKSDAKAVYEKGLKIVEQNPQLRKRFEERLAKLRKN